MSMVKSRLFASGLALAGLGAVALGYAAPHLSRAWAPVDTTAATRDVGSPGVAPIAVADTTTRNAGDVVSGPQPDAYRTVRVKAPHTAVEVDKERGKVAVRAPYTDVNVDPDKGRVRVRAPYVNLDIRW